MVLVWSHVGSSVLDEFLAILVRDDKSSVGGCSDGLCSPVEDEPLFDVPWGMVSDSQSVGSVTNVLSVVKSSVG